jgi:hypothetical protein
MRRTNERSSCKALINDKHIGIEGLHPRTISRQPWHAFWIDEAYLMSRLKLSQYLVFTRPVQQRHT